MRFQERTHATPCTCTPGHLGSQATAHVRQVVAQSSCSGETRETHLRLTALRRTFKALNYSLLVLFHYFSLARRSSEEYQTAREDR